MESIVIAFLGYITTLIVGFHSADKTASATKESVEDTFRNQRQLDKDRQEEIIQGVLHAIYEELDVVYRQLNAPQLKEAWEKFEDKEFWKGLPSFTGQDKPVFFGAFPTSVDFLIVYRSNASLIGQVENSELRSEIVRNYTFLQILLQSYERNRECFSQCLEAYDKDERNFANRLRSDLQKIAPILKENHDSVNESILELLKTLEEELSIPNVVRE